MINPNDFVIARKRKKYKFALFAKSPLCFEFSEWQKQPVDVVEIGAGTGLFSVELAKLQPQKVFLAIDVKGDRLQKGAQRAEELGLGNIYFLRARADQLLDIVAKESLSDIWITFPDPYPKKRSSGRRLTHATFLAIYTQLLKPGAMLHLKHDNPDFFCWSLEQMVASKLHLEELTFDLHDSQVSATAKIMTTYEAKWLDSGRTIHYVRARRNNDTIKL